MKNLLFILPIICLSFSLQAQQVDPDSGQQFTDVEQQFLEAVRGEDTHAVQAFIERGDVDVTSNELGTIALSESITDHNDIFEHHNDIFELLWANGARYTYSPYSVDHKLLSRDITDRIGRIAEGTKPIAQDFYERLFTKSIQSLRDIRDIECTSDDMVFLRQVLADDTRAAESREKLNSPIEEDVDISSSCLEWINSL